MPTLVQLDNCGIFEKFDLEHNLIKEYKHWYLLVRTKQINIGSCVAILKRHAFPLSEATPEEMAEYSTIAKEIENATRKSFGNYLTHHLCLMYLDKHIHFHIIPRYKNEIKFSQKIWVDDQIPDPLIKQVSESSQTELDSIKSILFKNF